MIGAQRERFPLILLKCEEKKNRAEKAADVAVLRGKVSPIYKLVCVVLIVDLRS